MMASTNTSTLNEARIQNTIVLRSDGSSEAFDGDKLQRSLQCISKGLDTKHINLGKIANKTIESLPEAIHIDELIDLLSETIASMTTIHPDHSLLAARVRVRFLWSQIPKNFSDAIQQLYDSHNEKTKKHSPLVQKRLLNLVLENKDRLNASVIPERDYQFTYFGVKTLEKSYLLKLRTRIAETPQFMLLRVSLGIHWDDIDAAIETYNLMSQRYFIHASPTLFNAGTNNAYLSSCFLLGISDDSIDGIYKTLHQCALISKASGGVGLHVSNIRSAGSYIAGSNGISNGIIPMLRVFNNTARYVDQGGNKRPGAFAIYLEPWHSDIFEFLNLRKNHGKEELRARDLFLALWIPDLFMKKVKNNEDWALFSPDEAKGLNECHSEEFEKLYNKYVSEGIAMKTVKAQKLWYAILEAQIETGVPFILYKDACNKKTNQKNLGLIKSSNLCCEVVQYSAEDEIAVCNLASVALPKFVKTNDYEMWYDFKELHKVVKIITRNLNKVIDVGDYPVSEAEYGNKKHRPIAIGVQGLADTFMELRMPYESKEAKELNIFIFETIYHAALEASVELAAINGPYETYQGSPASEGILQFDFWDHKPSEVYDWEALKAKMKEHGLRNSLLVAPMPTASTSQILGFTESFEPLTSNIYSRRVLSGEFQLVNKYLVQDLMHFGIWDEDMKNEIVDNEGSIQSIESIPNEMKELYKTVWEVSQKKIIDMAADRAPFIDQSQSMNIHLKNPTMSKLTSMHFYGWNKGLKTGMYYLRTQAAASAIKFTIDRSVTPVDKRIMNFDSGALKKKAYTPPLHSILGKKRRSSSLIDPKEELEEKQSIQNKLIHSGVEDGYDIYSTIPLVCNVQDPGNCESCSG